jgi:hypothetical protein
MWFIRLCILLFFFISPLSIAKNRTVYFEPKVSTLSGTIIILTFPGQPNYQNIEDGDAKETGAYLVLDEPVDVKLVQKIQMDNDEPENNVKMIQLAVQNDEDWKKLENGNHVRINGDLFRAIWGHHHTTVLINVKKIDVISKEKIVNNNLSVYLTDDDMEAIRSLQGIVEVKTQSNGLDISIKRLSMQNKEKNVN